MSNPAQTYESYMVPALFAPWAERLVDLAQVAPGEAALDVGCGTAIVPRRIAARTGREAELVALDRNPLMLAVARETAGREDAAIEFHQGVAEHLPFANARFDVVTSQFALMFFGDRPAALAEMRRVTKPDGRLAIATWQGIERHPFYATLDDAIRRRLGTSRVADIFALGDADTLQRLVEQAGYDDVKVTSASITARFPDPDGFLAGEIDVDTAAIPAMQHLDDAARQSMVDALGDDMADALRSVTQGHHVVIPFHAHLVVAR